jgi:hypothetical protein
MIKTSKSFYAICKKVNSSELMEKYMNHPKLEILDCDNILNYNEGYLNILFHGDDSEDSFLFVDGEFDSTTYSN